MAGDFEYLQTTYFVIFGIFVQRPMRQMGSGNNHMTTKRETDPKYHYRDVIWISWRVNASSPRLVLRSLLRLANKWRLGCNYSSMPSLQRRFSHTAVKVMAWMSNYIQSIYSKVHGGQHGAHLGPVGPRWAPCWPHKPCYQGLHPSLTDSHLKLLVMRVTFPCHNVIMYDKKKIS